MPRFFRDLAMWFWIDRAGWPLAAFSVLLAAALYVVRAGVVDWIGIGRDSGFSAWVALAVVVAIAALAFGLVHLMHLRRYLAARGYGLPALVLLAGVVVAVVLPVPWTTEQRSFYTRQPDYERVVALARANRLQRSAECPPPGFAAPAGLEDLGRQCLFVESSDTHGLVVEFTPRSIYRPVVYLERPDALLYIDACGLRGSATRSLAEHWYVCMRNVDPLGRIP